MAEQPDTSSVCPDPWKSKPDCTTERGSRFSSQGMEWEHLAGAVAVMEGSGPCRSCPLACASVQAAEKEKCLLFFLICDSFLGYV